MFLLHDLLLPSGYKSNWRQWISRNSFSQAQISFDLYTSLKLFAWYTLIHGLTSYLHYQKLEWCCTINCWLFLVMIIFSLRREKSNFVSPKLFFFYQFNCQNKNLFRTLQANVHLSIRSSWERIWWSKFIIFRFCNE